MKNEEELMVTGFDDINYDKELIYKNLEKLDLDNDTDRRIFYELVGCKIKEEDDYEEDELTHADGSGNNGQPPDGNGNEPLLGIN